ncbi:hypothetical protein D9M71_538490 [compost metagenome]
MEVDSDDGDTRIAFHHAIGIVTDTHLLLLSLMTAIPSLASIPQLTSQLTDPCDQDVHAAMMVEVSRALFVQADRTGGVTF